MIIIQHIEIIWTKASRGMPGAGKRNAVPGKLEVPVTACHSDGMLIHKVSAREQDGFALEQTTERVRDSGKYWTVSFRRENGAVMVLFTYDAFMLPAPFQALFNTSRPKTIKMAGEPALAIMEIDQIPDDGAKYPRLAYQIIDNEKTVKIIRMWTRYE